MATANNNEMVSIPYVVYEQEKERTDKVHWRLWILCIILIVALIGSNVAWIIYETQFETVTETEDYWYEVEQDNEQGDNNFIGHDGDITYGEAKN